MRIAILFVLGVLLAIPASGRAQTITYTSLDDPLSVQYSTSNNGGGGASDNESRSTLVPGFTDGLGQHDYGNSVSTFQFTTLDGIPGPTATSTLTLDGNGTNQLHIHFSGGAFITGPQGTVPFVTYADAQANSGSVSNTISNLIPGNDYTLQYSWNDDVFESQASTATPANFPITFAGIRIGGILIPAIDMANDTVIGPTGQPPAHSIHSGSGSVTFTAQSDTGLLSVPLFYIAINGFGGNSPADTNIESTFEGDLTVSVVPEPSTAVLLAIGALALVLVIRRHGWVAHGLIPKSGNV